MDNLDNPELDAVSQVHEQTENDTMFDDGFASLDSLDAAQNGEPVGEAEAAPESKMDSAAVVGMVGMGLFMSEQFISSSAGVEFAFDNQAKDKFLEASAPLVEKYGLTWLGWFEQYKEELLFGMAAFGLGYSSLNTIKRLQAEKLTIQSKAASNDDQEQAAAA